MRKANDTLLELDGKSFHLFTSFFREGSHMRELDEEHKSIGNETGSFPFSKGSDAATFARASKEKSMPHSPMEGHSFQGKFQFFTFNNLIS